MAFAEASGAPLAVAPNHWSDGCPTLEDDVPGPGVAVVVRSYLDPLSGRLLYAEAVPKDHGRSFEILPERWRRATSTAERSWRTTTSMWSAHASVLGDGGQLLIGATLTAVDVQRVTGHVAGRG